MVKKQRYSALGQWVFDSQRSRDSLLKDEQVAIATATSKTLAKRIANALNIYKPKRRTSRGKVVKVKCTDCASEWSAYEHHIPSRCDVCGARDTVTLA